MMYLWHITLQQVLHHIDRAPCDRQHRHWRSFHFLRLTNLQEKANINSSMDKNKCSFSILI